MTQRKPDLADARIIVPVRNGGERWRQVARALRDSVPEPGMVVVVDSQSSDGSDKIATDCGFELVRIDPRTFNHGRTRQQAVDRHCQGRAFVVFLTHDAVVEGRDSLSELLSAFEDERTGAAYGRQLPHDNAARFAIHTASYLYPAGDDTRSLALAERVGVRGTHLSNSFAAYRLQALRECGGFPSELILGEDVYVSLRMLQSGWSIRYRAAATVRHSHNYTIFQEMQRYFDYGVLHAQLPELLTDFGSAETEGMRFLRSELRYVTGSAPWLLPVVPVRNAAKYLGYRLGRHYRQLPRSLRRRLSMTRVFWDSIPAGRP